MRYRTVDELNHFDFYEAHIDELTLMNGVFTAVLDQVTILPENSCNRDIRRMRTNQLSLKLEEAEIVSMIEEGYKVFDANGNLSAEYDDRAIAENEYRQTLNALADSSVYSIQKSDSFYVFSVDTEDHTYEIKVRGIHDVEEWERFFSLD